MKLGPAQRLDVIIDDAKTLSNLLEVSSGEKFVTLSFFRQFRVANSLSCITVPNLIIKTPEIPARLIEIHMQGGAMGNLANALFEGEEEITRSRLKQSKLWAQSANWGL